MASAAALGYTTIIERLLQRKPDVNAAASDDGGRTALQAAAGSGHPAVVKRLRVGGARYSLEEV